MPRQPAMRQPTTAVILSFAAMQRAWKSMAARLPNARIKIVACGESTLAEDA